MAEAYKLLGDASFPRAIREADELADGTKLYETVGVNYAEGSYVLEEELTPRDKERAESGELDHLLEAASKDEAEEYRKANDDQYGLFVPEHSAEAVVLTEYGHEVIPREQVIELRSQDSDEVAEAVEAQKEEVDDSRPGLEPLSDEPVEIPEEGVEQPPGIHLRGEKKEKGEGGAAAKRGRPKKQETATPAAPAASKQESK